jgi:hypothetical protein
VREGFLGNSPEKKNSKKLAQNGYYSFSAAFVGNSVTPMSTLANNKRACSKKWEILGQNYVVLVFPAINLLARFCRAVLEFREHQGPPPDKFQLDLARSIAMPDPNRR